MNSRFSSPQPSNKRQSMKSASPSPSMSMSTSGLPSISTFRRSHRSHNSTSSSNLPPSVPTGWLQASAAEDPLKNPFGTPSTSGTPLRFGKSPNVMVKSPLSRSLFPVHEPPSSISMFVPSHQEKEVPADIYNAQDSTSTYNKFLANIFSSTKTILLENGKSAPVMFDPTDSLHSFFCQLKEYEDKGCFLIPSCLKEAFFCVYSVRNKLQHESGIHKYSDVLTLPFVKNNTWDEIDGFPQSLEHWNLIPQLLLEDWIDGDYKVVDTPTGRPYLA